MSNPATDPIEVEDRDLVSVRCRHRVVDPEMFARYRETRMTRYSREEVLGVLDDLEAVERPYMAALLEACALIHGPNLEQWGYGYATEALRALAAVVLRVEEGDLAPRGFNWAKVGIGSSEYYPVAEVRRCLPSYRRATKALRAAIAQAKADQHPDLPPTPGGDPSP